MYMNVVVCTLAMSCVAGTAEAAVVEDPALVRRLETVGRKSYYVPVNSSRSVTKNNDASGTYRVSFSTSSGALSGTFSVRASTEALA